MQRSPGQTPGPAEVAPRDAMLQQDAALRVDGEETCGTEAPPVPLARVGDHPGIARIARPLGATRFTGGGRYDSHPLSFSQHRGSGATAATCAATSQR